MPTKIDEYIINLHVFTNANLMTKEYDKAMQKFKKKLTELEKKTIELDKLI